MQFGVWTLSSPFTKNSSQAEAVKSLHFPEKTGLARYCHFTGFTEFDFIHARDFALSAQISKSCASTNSATPALTFEKISICLTQVQSHIGGIGKKNLKAIENKAK